MAVSIKKLKSSKSVDPPVTLIYGVDGVGKTTLAAEWPDPIYLPTQGETTPSDLDLPTPGVIENYNALMDVFAELLTEEHEFKTVIVDSVDGLEGLMWGETCDRLGVSSIEEPGFGKGYVEADKEWKEFLEACAAMKMAGLNVVLLAHPEIIRFDSPVTDPYSRFTIKLHKRANALIREQVDIVAFLNYRVSIKEKEVGRDKKVARGEGRERLIYLSEAPGYLAKNRYSMPDYITYRRGKGYAEMAKFFPTPEDKAAANDNGANNNNDGAGESEEREAA